MIFKLHRLICTRQPQIRLLSSSINKLKMSSGEKTGVKLSDVTSALEKIVPKKLAESWDKTGLLVEPYTSRPITKIFLTNDLTEDVAIEANDCGSEMIISYHPPIFSPLASVTQRTWKEKVVSFLLEKQIAMYSPHTSWDCVRGGVNDWLAEAFPFAESRPIIPGEDPNVGAGRILHVESPFTLKEAVASIKKLTGLKHIRLAMGKGRSLDSPIKDVALCAGSGGSLLKDITNVDLYLTGEMLHHDILDAAQKGISVILTNHSDSERGSLVRFANILQKELDNQVTVEISKYDKDPLTTV
ncbi:NIF3-like protein 1 isoform X2 [Epargyreus clarus]|uniref:NIF3-like protein 1 isoform X2 n=1 Tax=Epargyreus clarus TaxID=520877 RepID=UPI003C306C15